MSAVTLWGAEIDCLDPSMPEGVIQIEVVQRFRHWTVGTMGGCCKVPQTRRQQHDNSQAVSGSWRAGWNPHPQR